MVCTQHTCINRVNHSIFVYLLCDEVAGYPIGYSGEMVPPFMMRHPSSEQNSSQNVALINDESVSSREACVAAKSDDMRKNEFIKNESIDNKQ